MGTINPWGGAPAQQPRRPSPPRPPPPRLYPSQPIPLPADPHTRTIGIWDYGVQGPLSPVGVWVRGQRWCVRWVTREAAGRRRCTPPPQVGGGAISVYGEPIDIQSDLAMVWVRGQRRRRKGPWEATAAWTASSAGAPLTRMRDGWDDHAVAAASRRRRRGDTLQAKKKSQKCGGIRSKKRI